MSIETERYVFEVEWYDKVACTLKKFYLYYFPSDNSVELFDLKTKKTFLRRSRCEGVEAKDFYVGAVVTIFSRSMKITNFADQSTKEKLSSKISRTFLVIKPKAIEKLGEILKRVTEYDFHISNIKMTKINHEEALEIFKSSGDELQNVIENLTSGTVVAVELLSKNCNARWSELTAAFEKEAVLNSIYVPSDKDVIKNILRLYTQRKLILAEHRTEGIVGHFFFSSEKKQKCRMKNSAKLQKCTCCIIKPHAVQARLTSHIIDDIQKANFIITAAQQFFVEPVNAEEFLEVYKGVLPDYAAMVNELQSGPCIVMEITHSDTNIDVVAEFRKFCGPMDPEMAVQLRPTTLRAKYGKSKVQNAVHCSDLSEDGILEVEYFFKILDGD